MITRGVNKIKHLMLILISMLLMIGCSNNSDQLTDNLPKQLTDNLRTTEAIVLAKQFSEKQKKLLLTEDIHNSELLEDLDTIASQTPDEIIKNDKYNLHWLIVNDSSLDKLEFNDLKVGEKIKYTSENEHLDTLPLTSIAITIKKIN